MVGTACSKVSHVRREENASDVGAVSCEAAHRDQRGEIAILNHAPNEDTSGIVARAEHCSVRSDCDAGHGDIVFRDQLMAAFILAQIPHAYCAGTIATDEFTLVWMDHHIVDWTAMIVVALHAAGSSIPDLDSAIFRGCHHPFPLAVKGDTCDIVCVSLESQDSTRVGGLDVVELDGVVASGGEISFVWRDA